MCHLIKERVVVLTEDVPVLHEPEVLLPDRPLDGGGHPAAEDPPLLPLLQQVRQLAQTLPEQIGQ